MRIMRCGSKLGFYQKRFGENLLKNNQSMRPDSKLGIYLGRLAETTYQFMLGLS